MGVTVINESAFDTLLLRTGPHTQAIIDAAVAGGINLRIVDDEHLAVSLDETVGLEDIEILLGVIAEGSGLPRAALDEADAANSGIPAGLRRQSAILQYQIGRAVCRERGCQYV